MPLGGHPILGPPEAAQLGAAPSRPVDDQGETVVLGDQQEIDGIVAGQSLRALIQQPAIVFRNRRTGQALLQGCRDSARFRSQVVLDLPFLFRNAACHENRQAEQRHGP